MFKVTSMRKTLYRGLPCVQNNGRRERVRMRGAQCLVKIR